MTVLTRRRFAALATFGVAAQACARQNLPTAAALRPLPATLDAAMPSSPSSPSSPSLPPLPAAVTVQFTHDIVCPWCRIGHHNLAAALRQWQGGTVQLQLRPYLLNPDAPAAGVELRAYLAAKYGAGNLDAMLHSGAPNIGSKARARQRSGESPAGRELATHAEEQRRQRPWLAGSYVSIGAVSA